MASEMIREAVGATLWHYGEPPALGMVTFINRDKVRPTMVRGVPTWGRTYRLAGFEDCGETKGSLLALILPPERMPAPKMPRAMRVNLPPLPLFDYFAPNAI